jgi:hypothetical protein
LYFSKVAERVAFDQIPASLDIVSRDSGRVGNSVLDSACFALDIHLLATGNESSYAEGASPTEEVGGVSGWAAADFCYAVRAGRSGGLVELDRLVGGRKVLVMNRGGRAEREMRPKYSAEARER